MSSKGDGNIFAFAKKSRGAKDGAGSGSYNGGGNPPGGGDLESRVAAIEKAIPDIRERLIKVETRLDHIEKNMATKADLEALKGSISAELHKAINDQTWKFIGVSISFSGLFAAIAFGLARFLK